MKRLIVIAAAAAAMTTPMATFAQTNAQTHPQQYHGHDRAHYAHCKKSSGKTGLLAGAGGGGLGAAALGAGPIGIAAGVVGGGLLGRHIDKKHDAAQNRKNGC